MYIDKSLGNVYQCCHHKECTDLKKLVFKNVDTFQLPNTTDDALARAFVEMYEDILTVNDDGDIKTYSFNGLYWKRNGHADLEWNLLISTEFYNNLNEKAKKLIETETDPTIIKQLYAKQTRLNMCQVCNFFLLL